mmetsp:Transcript_72/g.163  ORF Transcript_72/g.163 Transcript_72/m.163 type:complete len:132 (+) Transcript_72:181-576(+)
MNTWHKACLSKWHEPKKNKFTCIFCTAGIASYKIWSSILSSMMSFCKTTRRPYFPSQGQSTSKIPSMAHSGASDDEVEQTGDAVPLAKLLVQDLDLVLVVLGLVWLVLNVVPLEHERGGLGLNQQEVACRA